MGFRKSKTFAAAFPLQAVSTYQSTRVLCIEPQAIASIFEYHIPFHPDLESLEPKIGASTREAICENRACIDLIPAKST